MVLIAILAATGMAGPPTPLPGPPAPPPPVSQSTAAGKLTARARPLEPLSHWISDSDYPPSAQRRNAQGVTYFRLRINPIGNVETCTITRSSGDAELDDAACRVMRIRGRFSPARDSHGAPTFDEVENRIRWVLPQESFSLVPFELARFVTRLAIDASGEVRCTTNLPGHGADAAGVDCGAFGGAAVGARLRAMHAVGSLTAIQVIAPDGEAWPQVPSDYGRRIYEEETALTLDAAGRVTSCRVVREERAQIAVVSPSAGPCGVYRAGGPALFEPARDGRANRILHVTISFYSDGIPIPGITLTPRP
jgi:TonB family protein